MSKTSKLILATLPVLGLAACGDSSVGQAIGTSEPQVRIAHVAPGAPNVTLQRNGSARSDATNIAFGFVSNYSNVDNNNATWSINVTSSGASVGSLQFDADRGKRYTVAAVADSASANSVLLVIDPTNKSLTSDAARVRVLNASYNAQNIDVYLIKNQTGTIATVTPQLPNIAFKNAKPSSGSDSDRYSGGPYTVTITSAGTKTVLFQGKLSIGDDKDVLFVTVPNDVSNPTGLRLLVKVEGDAGATDVPPV